MCLQNWEVKLQGSFIKASGLEKVQRREVGVVVKTVHKLQIIGCFITPETAMKQSLAIIELESYADRCCHCCRLEFNMIRLETPSLFFAGQIVTQMLDSRAMPHQSFPSSLLTVFRLFRE